ncbi:MAG: tetratricopeptide repeat protein, partial [Acidobacteriota bacterium]
MSRITPLAAYSARIKELYIELDHYAFFHGPSEVDRIDRRFTGRREVLDRLKSLLTDHESPAGAYLVTGFRGAGKSSLVARALSEIMAGHWEMISARRALRIVSPVIGSALLPTPWPVGVLVFLVGIAVIAVAGLAVSDPDRHDRVPASHRRRWAEWAQTARRALILRREPPPVSRFRTLVKDLVAILILVLLSQMIFGLFAVYGGRIVSPDVIVHRLAVVGLLAAVHVGLVSAITELAGTGLIDKAGRFLVKVRQALASRRWVHVKINLSQDNLQEIDILRSIASSLESEYRRFARPSFRRIVIRSLLLLPFLLIAALIYQTTLFHWAQDVKHDLHIACALPSQALYDPADLQNAEPRSPRASGTFPELTLQSVDRQPVFSTLDTYQMVLRHHRVGLAVGTDELRRALDRRLREQRSRFGIATTHGILHETPEGALGELYATFFLVTTEIDTLIQLVYGKVVTSLTPPWATSSTDPLPPTLDYALVLFLVLGWIVPVRLMRWSVLDRPSHRDILRQVRDLNDMIASEVTHEQGGVPFQASSLISLSFGRRQRQTYRNLNEREIEKRLIDILWHSQRVSPLEIRPEFVVVFDELDKIQHTPVDQGQATDTGVDASKTPDLGPVDVVERNRQHRILSLVSNLKHFLSTAPAKFIFIAGREMFDAALADVSDRHFFMGSVFNEVLHVPSFHSDASDERLPDITSLPEEVLCRFLLPRDFSGRPSLAAFREHLERHLLPAGGPCPTWLLDQQRHKVMYELHNFVTYLTYRSNGAPKRITATLERFIVRLPDRFVRQTTDEPKPSGDYRDPHHLVVGRSSRSLYLRFRYADQYTFGLVTYLASPLIFSVNRAIKDYGDKILVSSAFVLDHIFKFHGHGFSWRNLELLPDVVDINRAPQLRELISHIMRFLSRGHINEIISGLYRFKFTRRISEEINFLSKLSEHESAAFNFTLDESLNLKRRFYRQLNRLLETHSRYPDGWSDEHDFVHSVAFLRMILGDLHYYDGEYDSAIVEYMEAVQQLRRVRPDERADTLVLMIRNFLKLGLTYERKKTFDSALVTYGRIAAIVQEFGRRHLREGSDTAAPTSAVDSLDHDPGPATLEGHRLIFQPMFARLQSLEKATMGGISPRDLEHVQRELDSLLGPEQQEKRFLATSEFYNKVGDILFFKNGPMPPADAVSCRRRRRWRPGGAVRRGLSVLSGERRDKRSAPRSPILLGFANPHQEDLVRQRRRLPCAACGSYNNALLVMCRHFLEIPEERLREPGQVLISILQSFEPSSEATARTAPDRRNFLFELGDLLSDLGDTYIGCAYVPSRADRSGSTLDAEPAGDAIPAEALTLLV